MAVHTLQYQMEAGGIRAMHQCNHSEAVVAAAAAAADMAATDLPRHTCRNTITR